MAARRKSMGLFEDALKGINANNNKCVDGATLRDPEANEDALVSKPEAVFVAQKVLKRRCTIAEALLRLQPKFQKSKVGNWSIYDLFIKVGILGH